MPCRNRGAVEEKANAEVSVGLCRALQFGATVKLGKLETLDIDDTFCAAHGGQQLAFWNAHHDERGFASMHIYHVASGTPVAAILRPARTPKGRRGVHRHQACDQAPAPPFRTVALSLMPSGP